MRRSRKPLCRASGTGGSNPPLSALESQESCVETWSPRPGFSRVRGQVGGKLNNTHVCETDGMTPDSAICGTPVKPVPLLKTSA